MYLIEIYYIIILTNQYYKIRLRFKLMKNQIFTLHRHLTQFLDPLEDHSHFQCALGRMVLFCLKFEEVTRAFLDQQRSLEKFHQILLQRHRWHQQGSSSLSWIGHLLSFDLRFQIQRSHCLDHIVLGSIPHAEHLL